MVRVGDMAIRFKATNFAVREVLAVQILVEVINLNL